MTPQDERSRMDDDREEHTVALPTDVWEELLAEAHRSGDTPGVAAERLIRAGIDGRGHTLFQVSTTAALVKGVFSGATTVRELKQHGDFGIGTFDGLDGELILLDGVCYRATGGGTLSVADDDQAVPFAVVTQFSEDGGSQSSPMPSLAELGAYLDGLRPSQNVFMAVRADGHLAHLSMRAACRAHPGEDLVSATNHQSEFEAVNVRGTLLGFWSPPYARSFNVPGYHFHFVSADRSLGGHVLDLAADALDIGVHVESDIHVALPDTAEFLAADLRGDTGAALNIAESSRQ
jgi:acetolactate decarboxylase